MWLKRFVVIALFQVMMTAALDSFLDCPGHDKNLFGVLRRCCKSKELPNGCECFDISDKTVFRNSAFHKPQCPPKLGVQFHLFTRGNTKESEVIKASDDTLNTSRFDPSLPTKFIIHGFTDQGPNTWSLEMTKALLEEADMNVIIVNWKEGAKGFNYYQATANVRSTGAMVAQLIRVMKREHGVSLDAIHLIGHSLGAHVSAMAGKEVKRLEFGQIGRITGLDPAGPMFDPYLAMVKLNVSDAKFVDVIHTNSIPITQAGFGTIFSCGDVDFYPNGGLHQPGCRDVTKNIATNLNFKDLRMDIACSHVRCPDIFTDSIRKCKAVTKKDNNCVMGYHTSQTCRGVYYPLTTKTRPFCQKK